MNRKALVAIVAGFALTITAWAWAQQGAAPQQAPTGSMGQGMMGQQGGSGPGGMMGGQTPQGGQPAGPGTVGPRQGRGTHRGGTGIGRGPSLYERPLISEMLSLQQQLGLSDQQVQRLETLRADFNKEAIKRDAEIRTAEIDLSQLLAASPPDMAKVEAQMKKIAALQAKLRFARIRTLEQGRTVLSQGQWQKFESMAPQTGPMGPYGGPWQQGQLGPGPYGAYGMMGPGMMGGYGGPGGMMGDYGPGTGYGPGSMMGGYGPGGMMGGYGGPGGMMGGYGPGGQYGQRQFSSNGEQIYFTGVSQKGGYIPRVGGPPWAQRVGCVACHGSGGRGGVPVMMGTAIPADIRDDVLTGKVPEAGGEKMDHPPYTDATIKRAITQGVDPADKPLDWTMPRWQMSDDDLSDILAFLKTLR